MMRWIACLFVIVIFGLPVAAQDMTAEQQIADLVDGMQAAVRARDEDAYLSHVDPSDATFALEHSRWADEWAGEDIPANFALSVDNIAVMEDEATADMTMTWRRKDNDNTWQATYPVRFTQTAAGEWQYAGELWVTTETDHFTLRAAPGLEADAAAILPYLGQIYDDVTAALEHEPSRKNEIKLYTTPEALVANTLLSLPLIHGWNEPGKSLKLWPDSGMIGQSTLAHEFTHFLTFDMADTTHGHFPWWLEEGLAQYVASEYWPQAQRDGYLQYSQNALQWQTLADWDDMSDYNTTPLELWSSVYPQGYAFVRFVTEVYSSEWRNRWLRALADIDLEPATEQTFHKSFDDMDQEFRAWLANG